MTTRYSAAGRSFVEVCLAFCCTSANCQCKGPMEFSCGCGRPIELELGLLVLSKY